MAVTCVACLRLLDVRRPPGSRSSHASPYLNPPVTSQHMEFILLCSMCAATDFRLHLKI